MFVASTMWPARVNESHVLDSRAQAESRDTAMMAHLQESIFNEGGTNCSRLSLSSRPSPPLSLFLFPHSGLVVSLCHFPSFPSVGLLWAHKIFQKIPEDSPRRFRR